MQFSLPIEMFCISHVLISVFRKTVVMIVAAMKEAVTDVKYM
jgi:hypothetical protein